VGESGAFDHAGEREDEVVVHGDAVEKHASCDPPFEGLVNGVADWHRIPAARVGLPAIVWRYPRTREAWCLSGGCCSPSTRRGESARAFLIRAVWASSFAPLSPKPGRRAGRWARGAPCAARRTKPVCRPSAFTAWRTLKHLSDRCGGSDPNTQSWSAWVSCLQRRGLGLSSVPRGQSHHGQPVAKTLPLETRGR
jgi:hypothetical protein